MNRYSYYPSIAGLPDGATVTEYLWTPTNGTSVGASGTQYTCFTTWTNTPNSGSTVKKLKVRIKYHESGSSTLIPITSDEEIIEVRHIGAISSVTISGSTYSNGNTYQHPCGTSSIGVSIPNVVTDPPQSVTYTVYYDIPAAEGYRMMAYPNPTKNVLTLELKSEDVSSIDTNSQSSAERVKSVPVKDFVKDNASKEGPKVDLNVSDLPRGVYYLHINPKEDSKQKVQIIQVRLE